jgi:hypothetical protein
VAYQGRDPQRLIRDTGLADFVVGDQLRLGFLDRNRSGRCTRCWGFRGRVA